VVNWRFREQHEGSKIDVLATIDLGPEFPSSTPNFTGAVPRPLESVVRSDNGVARGYDVSPDGRRFITTRDTERSPEPPPAQMILVLNWAEELQRRVPAT